MTAILSEPRISLVDLARREGVHVATVWRWCLRGVRGHRLESFSIGGRKFTSLPSYERWIAALNGEKIRSETPAAYERRQRAAEKTAEELGL